eukprot:COSAG06_NODE_14533_length_1149_cov_1.080000_1_plen_242_part_10
MGGHKAASAGAGRRTTKSPSPTLAPAMSGPRTCFCLAKARPVVAPPGHAHRGDEASAAELDRLPLEDLKAAAAEAGVAPEVSIEVGDTAEAKKALAQLIVRRRAEADHLRTLKLSELRRRAKQAGCDDAQLEAAVDADRPNEALAALIVSAAETPASASRHGDDEASALLVDELRGLRLTALSKRALSMGVDSESVEEAMDADDAKSALIALIVAIESRRGPADRMISMLEGGGEACAEMMR